MERGSDTNEIADMNVYKERIKEEHYSREIIIIRNIVLSKELRAKRQSQISCCTVFETTKTPIFLLFAGITYYLSTDSTGLKIIRIVVMYVNDKLRITFRM
jgi:hypothetical protein